MLFSWSGQNITFKIGTFNFVLFLPEQEHITELNLQGTLPQITLQRLLQKIDNLAALGFVLV